MNPEAKTLAGDPPRAVPSRHLGTTVVLFLMVAACFWVLAIGAQSDDPPDGQDSFLGRPLLTGLAVILSAGAVALPTRTRLGLWLGRTAGIALVGVAAVVLWSVLLGPDSHSAWQGVVLAIAIPQVLLLGGIGLGVLLVLMPPRQDAAPPQA